MIAIVDYGAGNLVSVKKALNWLGQECVITSDATQIAQAGKIILPGVGHFASTAALKRSGMQEAIADSINREVPFLGICVGMQWMFEAQPGIARDARPRPVAGGMRALSRRREIAPRWLESAGGLRIVKTISRSAVVILRVLHALFSRPH